MEREARRSDAKRPMAVLNVWQLITIQSHAVTYFNLHRILELMLFLIAHVISCYRKVAGSIPLVYMSVCYWARYWTPNCSWCAGQHLAWQPQPWMNVCMNLCKSLWTKVSSEHNIETWNLSMDLPGERTCCFLKVHYVVLVIKKSLYWQTFKCLNKLTTQTLNTIYTLT